MNKKELIQTVARKSGLTQMESEKALTSILDAINESLDKEESVVLRGFGTFSIKERKARTGFNITTGERIDIAAKKVISFKVSVKR